MAMPPKFFRTYSHFVLSEAVSYKQNTVIRLKSNILPTPQILLATQFFGLATLLHGGALVVSAPPNLYLKHYKSVEILSNFQLRSILSSLKKHANVNVASANHLGTFCACN